MLGGVANVEEIGVIREVIHTTILDRAIKIINVNQKKEGAKYRTLWDTVGLRECSRIKFQNRKQCENFVGPCLVYLCFMYVYFVLINKKCLIRSGKIFILSPAIG